MQFTAEFKKAIAAGNVQLTFRNWQKPQARAGGCYNIPPHGAIEVEQISLCTLAEVTAGDLKQCGVADMEALRKLLRLTAGCPPDLPLYRIKFRYLGAAAVKQPRTAEQPDPERMIKRLPTWAYSYLAAIAEHPGRRAGDLAPLFEMPLPAFKARVRRLKTRGLTISLDTGYRLSPLGKQVLGLLQQQQAQQ